MGRFFFDGDDDGSLIPESMPKPTVGDAKSPFFTMGEAGLVEGVVPNFFDAEVAARDTNNKEGTAAVEVQAQMKKMKTVYLEIDYGTYQNNYAVHITPVHEKKNIATEKQVQQVLHAAILALNEVVPYQVKVLIHPPRPEWKLKVISFVIEGATKAWNFDQAALEAKVIPKMFEEVQKIILKG